MKRLCIFAHYDKDNLIDDYVIYYLRELKKSFNKIGHDLSFDNYVYVQTSARMYRNVIDFKLIKNFPQSDIYVWYLFLDKGKVYLEHELMSQYNISLNGIWNTLSNDEKLNRGNKIAIICNKFFNYKYAKFYARQIKNKNFKFCKMLLGSHFAMWLVTNNYLKI